MVMLNPEKGDEGFGMMKIVPWSDKGRREVTRTVSTFTEMSFSQHFPTLLKDGQIDTYYLICLIASDLFPLELSQT